MPRAVIDDLYGELPIVGEVWNPSDRATVSPRKPSDSIVRRGSVKHPNRPGIARDHGNVEVLPARGALPGGLGFTNRGGL